MGICAVQDCEKPAITRGWCNRHYKAWRIYGDPEGRYQRPACAVEGCKEPHQAKGYCAMHYRRWSYSGDPGVLERKNFPRPETCTVDGCDTVTHAKGLCATHLSRLTKYGDVNANPFKPRGNCTIDGCDRPHTARGYCQAHYWMWRKYGDAEAEPYGYAYAHVKVYRLRGRARDQQCSHCDRQAHHWAYDHSDPDERLDPKRGAFSFDPARYLPLCGSCHKIFDKRTEPDEPAIA